MATPITFRQQTENAATSILNRDKVKLTWTKLLFADMPKDIQALAISAVETELAAKAARADLQAALDDKVDAPAGKRLVVTLGRDVGPSTDGVLIAWASASTSATRTISFADFVKA